MAEADWKYLQYNIETGQKRTGDGPSGGASSLSDLDDTSISNPSDGQMLGYDETEGKWKNVNAQAGSVTDVQVDGSSVVNQQGVAEITLPSVPIQDVQVDGTSVVNQQGVAEITMPTPPTPDYPVTDVKVNGTSVVSNKQALITSYKEVTQAQYEALPDTKLNDGVLYAIKDGGQAVDGFPPLIYSDEEREIGVWRDGKPLYQRTFHVTATGNSDTDLDTNIDHFFLVGNTYYGDTDKLSEQYIGSGVTAYCYLQTVQVNGVWTLRLHNMHNNTLTFWVTVRYTKTTDTPGSGIWNAQGALAHHYSTEEKVIGTWIDGKPLYEITIPTGTLPNSTSMNLPTPSNIKEVVNYSGFIKSTTDATTQRPIPFSAGGTNDIRVDLNSSTLRIWTFSDWRTYSGYLVIQYTKITD